MQFGPEMREGLDRLFRWRRDVRRFRADPIPEALLDRLLAQAATAPSVGLSQPWRWVRVETDAARSAVKANFEAANAEALAGFDSGDAESYARLKLAGLDQAPVHLAAFCDDATPQGKGLGARTMPETRRYSVVCAINQLWLSARAHGLGLGWVSILDPARVAQDLDVPEDWRFIAYLCLGYAQEVHEDPELERAGWETRRAIPAIVR